MAFDAAAGEVVLFGGIERPQGGPLGDTWVGSGGAWRPVRGPGPPARRYAALAFDPDLGGCVLHGGAADDHGHVTFGDAWLFRDHAWTRLPEGFYTTPRDDHGLAYHATAGRLVMLGGLAGYAELLLRSPDGWEPADVDPHPRHQWPLLAWDDRLGGLVMHGGEAGHGGPQFDVTRVLRLASEGQSG